MVLNHDTEIEILLFDQEKIVTYKYINNKFNITPKEAQDLLKTFIQSKRKEDKKSKFHVTYLIVGENKQNKSKKVSLVNENDLDALEKEVKILSKQVYSIQNRIIDDFNFFYSNDIDASNNIDRKSNLEIVYNETVPMDITSSIDSIIVESKKEPDVSKLSINKTTDSNKVLKPSNDSAKQKDYKQKENIKDSINHQKESKVKEEPAEVHSEVIAKKPKIHSEPEKEPIKHVASKPVPKKNAPTKKDGKQQPTLNSFFKKA